jgi:hypothetical protein
LSTDNGQSIWKESKKQKSSLPRGLGTKLLIAHYGGFNFFDLKTGENLEKKDARGDGEERIPIEQDFYMLQKMK